MGRIILAWIWSSPQKRKFSAFCKRTRRPPKRAAFYVFMPYTLAKDTRTGFENGNIAAVMDGDLDGFINAYLTASATGELKKMAYEDVTFFEILAEELALRDLDAERATEENYDEVMDRMEQYMGEFTPDPAGGGIVFPSCAAP